MPDENDKDKARKAAAKSVSDKFMEGLDLPGRAMRSGIGAYLQDEPVWEAIKNPQDAPTGCEIAEMAGEKYDIQNPYALTGIATAADVIDPVGLLPGGLITKIPKAAKVARGVSALGKGEVQAENTAKLLKLREILSQPEKYGHLPEFKQAAAKLGQVKKTDIPIVGEPSLVPPPKIPSTDDVEFEQIKKMIEEAAKKAK